MDLFKKLLEAANQLDLAFCDLIHHGNCNLTGSEYEKIMDVFLEAETFLKKQEVII